MDSKIKLDEVVKNKDRHFGSQIYYYPCIVVDVDGNERNALFTENQIEVAINRADSNPEDIPKELTFWDKLFGD